ncbi:MAG: tRNA (uridine(34)/cytosine(34)/5-carboxymethylaminomethyluridine(34)-2'-O)-methyltransferase TrmL [Nitrospirales bacterium]|nr:tRNA (uridine(34)/cytosine(34)/5-carboxymethylaminomethyluridine(34)-2'-O)-methyltransferase TrmL [Nitrospira sp.]MDR4502622.1 tRNA (uridine(34)/cytosine(34)/5-carboxymethylaminomethyluridine(34)-2'-O)-methyltransferase TrmL [Nitrospirales bacterium]
MIDVVLYQPEIPPNTGNIIRLCANTGFPLHIIRPLGFRWGDKGAKRAGLDYHELAIVTLHLNLQAYYDSQRPSRVFGITTKGRTGYHEVDFRAGDALLFGPETRGLPQDILESLPEDHRLRIPMHPESRSVNLSNAVAIVVYEAWRQQDFTSR